MNNAAVIGGGAFGTALAKILVDAGAEVTMWVREPELVADITDKRENTLFMPGFELPDAITATSDLAEAVTGRDVIVVAVPTAFLRAVLGDASQLISEHSTLVTVSKGIEVDSGLTMADVQREVLPLPLHRNLAFLSGPSFARELMKRQPTTVAVAAQDLTLAEKVQRALTTDYFRIYTTNDVIGVEVGGAVKNVMAIATGIVDGLGLGTNTRAALLTRGLAEITRLGVRMGANPLTFAGLAGMGDLVLTCTGDLSRNRQVGLELGRGMTLDEILADMRQVAEGVRTTRSVYDLSHKLGVEMPIADQVFHILYRDKDPRVAVVDLMTRAPKRELG
jgi:glycerol-3-phosphate dehydrogenase (NAD(P)+)